MLSISISEVTLLQIASVVLRWMQGIGTFIYAIRKGIYKPKTGFFTLIHISTKTMYFHGT